MSLKVPAELLERAEKGAAITDEEFLTVVAESLPYAWKLITSLRDRLDGSTAWVDNTEAPADEDERGQLLRFVGSDAMRAAVERRFGVRIAFQNCHRLALFEAWAADERQDFTSTRAQLLNQSPESVNC